MTPPVLAHPISVILAGLDALAVPRTRSTLSTTAPLTPASRRTIELTTEARLADVEQRRAPPTPDLDDSFVHRSGGQELDGDADLRENGLVDRTLHRRARHRELGRQPGLSLFPPPYSLRSPTPIREFSA